MDDFETGLQKIEEQLGIITGTSTKPKIFIIDDDRGIRGSVRAVLEDEFEVTVFSDSESVFSDYGLIPAVILLDVKMPAKNGLEIFPELKHKYPEVPIIFFTGYPGSHEKYCECQELKPFAIINKGCGLDELRDVIEKAISS